MPTAPSLTPTPASGRTDTARAAPLAHSTVWALFDRSAVGAAEVSDAGVILRVNDAFAAMLDYGREELAGRSIVELTVPEDVGLSQAGVARVFSGQDAHARVTKRYLRRDGGVVSAIVSITRVRAADGASHGFAQIIDISALRESERLLTERTQLAWTLFEESPVAAVITDAQGTILRVNQAVERLIGRCREDIIGRRTADFTHVEDVGLRPPELAHLEPGTRRIHDKRLVHCDGHAIWTSVHTTAIDLPDGTRQLLSFLVDVTESRRMRDELLALTERWQLAALGAGIGIWEIDFTSGRIAWDELTRRLYDLPPEMPDPDFAGWLERLLPEDRVSVLTLLQQRMRPEATNDFAFDFRIHDRAGNIRWIRSTGFGHRDAQGRPLRALGINQDITAERIAADERTELATRLSLATAGARIGVWSLDVDTLALTWDETSRALYGVGPRFPVPDLATWVALMHPDDRSAIEAGVQERLAAHGPDEIQFEFRARQPDGGYRWMRSAGRVFRDEQGRPYRALGVNWDITEQREAEQQLRAVSERLSLANEAAGIGVWELDSRSGTLVWDAQWRRLLAVDATEPASFEGWFGRIHPDDRERLLAAAQEMRSTGGPLVAETQYRVVLPDGDIRWLRSVCRVLRGADGAAERVLGAEWDISAQEFSNERIREQAAALKEAQRIARLGSWRLDIASGRMQWSDEIYAAFSWDRATPIPDFKGHAQFYTPESWAQLESALQRLVDTGKPVEQKVTLFTREGVRFMLMRGEPRRDAAGRITAVHGTAQDITEETLRNRQVEELSRLPAENPNPILRYSLGGEVKYFNRNAGAFLSLLGRGGGADETRWLERVRQSMTAPVTVFEFEIARQVFQFECRVVAEHGYANFYGRDVTNERQQQRRVQLQAAAMNAAYNVMFICDRDGRIEWVNHAFTEVTGYDASEVLGQTPRLLKSGRQSAEWYQSMWATLLRGDVWRAQLTNRRKGGDLYDVDETITPMRDETGVITHFVAVHEDVTERKRTEQRMLQLAMFDSVTGLPNRNMFQRHVGEAIARAHRIGRPFALMLLDLDHFKGVNDSLGHAAGDDLLTQVARRLSGALREDDFVARLGGDEFALLIEGLEEPQRAADAAHRVLEVFQQPFKVQNHDFMIRGSLGIAVYHNEHDTADVLIKHADLAMYAAKGRGRGSFQFFDAAMDAMARLRFTTEAALHEALRLDRLTLVFQPQFDLRTRRPIGSEALLRWNHPERGPIAPTEFVALAEQCGMIFQLDDFVLRKAIAQAAEWKQSQPQLLPVAINLSAGQFDVAGLADKLARLLREHGLDATDVELEITESVIMRRSSTVQENVRALSALGVPLAIDDFGTGYSSLLSLRDFPVRRLKIDASFVRGIGVNPKDEQIVRAIVMLGASLGLQVLAEGVETEAQAAFLATTGCAEVQGYLLGRPQPAAALQQSLAA